MLPINKIKWIRWWIRCLQSLQFFSIQNFHSFWIVAQIWVLYSCRKSAFFPELHQNIKTFILTQRNVIIFIIIGKWLCDALFQHEGCKMFFENTHLQITYLMTSGHQSLNIYFEAAHMQISSIGRNRSELIWLMLAYFSNIISLLEIIQMTFKKISAR